jgi:hypothetical protein
MQWKVDRYAYVEVFNTPPALTAYTDRSKPIPLHACKAASLESGFVKMSARFAADGTYVKDTSPAQLSP